MERGREPTYHHPYSPTSNTPQRPYFPETFQPSTSHKFSSNGPISQSPRGPGLTSPLPPPSTLSNPSQHVGASRSYQSLTSSPVAHQQRPFSSHQQSGIMSTSYEPLHGAHVRSSSRASSLHQSPSQTHTLIKRETSYNDTRPQSQGVSDEARQENFTKYDVQKSDRASNPMSFASILSSSNNELTPPKRSESQPKPTSPITMVSPVKVESTPQPVSVPVASPTIAVKANGTHDRPKSSSRKETVIVDKPRHTMTRREKEKFARAVADIEQTEFSDDATPGFFDFKELYTKTTNKRARGIEVDENRKKRMRRTFLLDELNIPMAAHSAQAEHRYRELHATNCAKEITDRDVADEKERKKDMQRKRRREQQIRNEESRLAELQQQQMKADDPEEVLRYDKQIQRSKDKLLRTAELLEGGGPQDDLEVSIMAPNFEGGTTSSFHLGSEEPVEPPKKKLKGANGTGNRPKKSKEKKQAEKDAAEAAYAAGWHENNRSSPMPIAPREESKAVVSRTSKGRKIDLPPPVVNFDSKGYNQLVEQIIRDMARKDVGKTYKIKQQSIAVKQENMRKTAILASKQARKWQERTNKSMKDTQARAKRVMREMMSFWKRNEREERDQRRMAEKQELENAKKAEADREANRQRRKLNFLISQTELYSHFIGKRIKTDEIERATDDPDVAASAVKIQDTNKPHTINLPASNADLTGKTKVTKFDELDFDAEDESALQEAAMANAQNAMDEAQARARAFDNDNENEDNMAAMDHSDMNFMNPTMAGDVQVTQPDMLQAQLKEYQLKGLNWLVNLYEQGINGILADEMGLGKTIQSISVMGYLAEKHNVWGPFLVIAPASTLHNWQQEITRFVPNLKVLPYWGNAKDRKVLRKFWDRKHISYNQDSEFHVLVTSYQLVVQDAQYFQKVKWQYMILDEAQAIKSSQSSRWKVLLGFHCRNRLLLTGTPIQNNMQELWALLHFIMPTLFDSHDEFSEWFSKDIESHAQSNTKLNQDQLRRLHMILKPFMLRRVKAHVQKELGDKVEKDIFCDLSYRQRAYYANLRSKISIMDLIEKVSMGDDQDAATLMNLVMQFRKVCNHPDLFERADTDSPFSMSAYAETASFMREGSFVHVGYSIKNPIEYDLPKLLCNDEGRLDIAGPANKRAGFIRHATSNIFNIFKPQHVENSSNEDGTFSFLRFIDQSASDLSRSAQTGVLERSLTMSTTPHFQGNFTDEGYESDERTVPTHKMLHIAGSRSHHKLLGLNPESTLGKLCNISTNALAEQGFSTIESAASSSAFAPPIEITALLPSIEVERQNVMFNPVLRNALFKIEEPIEHKLLEANIDPKFYPPSSLLPKPEKEKAKFTSITVPSMRRFVTDSGKLAKLDELLGQLKIEGHRVLLYFQMTRMIDLMEEYLTYRNYKYCRLDGSTKLEDRRDTVHDFQTRPEIFIFLLSTRAGGLGINLTAADTVIFYDSDWNPTIDSQAMDRAHRLGQTRQVTVYRLITRGTIEERIRKRAMQKEEVQRVVITGGDGSGVDFNTRSRDNRTKDIAMWLADDDEAALIEQKEKENAAKDDRDGKTEKKMSKKAIAAAGAAERRRARLNMDDLYHEGEGNFDDQSAKASGTATPVPEVETPVKKKGARTGFGKSKKAKTAAQRLAIIDATGDLGMGGGD